MPTKARVAVLVPNEKELSVIDAILPDPGPHQVVVKQFSSGICHTQLHQIHMPRSAPVILGHESTGVVIAKGSDVNHVKEGDSIMLTWVPRNKTANPLPPQPAALLLPGGQTAASHDVFTWADHTIADEQYVVKMSDDAAKDVTAIIPCAVMTGAGAVLHTAGVRKGQSVAVFGVGGVGLSALAAARVVGADPIIAVDLDDGKLEFARRFGATITVNAAKEDPVKAIRKATRHALDLDFFKRPVAGVDFAFDCIGRKATMEQILGAARSGSLGAYRGGTAVLVGVPLTVPELNASDVLINEKKFIGSNGGSCEPDRDFPVFLDWHRTGQLDLDTLVTQRFTLDRINEAVMLLETGGIQGRAILEFS